MIAIVLEIYLAGILPALLVAHWYSHRKRDEKDTPAGLCVACAVFGAAWPVVLVAVCVLMLLGIPQRLLRNRRGEK